MKTTAAASRPRALPASPPKPPLARRRNFFDFLDTPLGLMILAIWIMLSVEFGNALTAILIAVPAALFLGAFEAWYKSRGGETFYSAWGFAYAIATVCGITTALFLLISHLG